MELNSVLAEMGITNEAQDSEVAKVADAEGTSGTTGNYSDAEKTLTASADNKLMGSSSSAQSGRVPVYNGDAMFGTNFIGPGPDGKEANPYKLSDPDRPGKFL